jgi:hypothetical protein
VAISTAQVAVSTTAAKLTTTPTDSRAGSSIAITAPSAADLYVGGSGVTSSNGFRVVAGATLTVDLQSGEDLYGVLASGTGTAYVLRSGV